MSYVVHGGYTDRGLGKGLASKCVVHLLLPVSFYPPEYVLVRHVFDLRLVVVGRVILEDDTDNLVLGPSKPSLL